MKQVIKLFFLAMLVIFASCKNEPEEDSQTLLEKQILLDKEMIVSDAKKMLILFYC